MALNPVVEKALRRNFVNPSKFLLAVSGGTDSQVLIKAFSHVARKLGHEVHAMGVNHGLRKEASSELLLAGALCEKEGVSFTHESIQVTPGGNLQARARDGRYSVLSKKAFELGAALVTAHHQDDFVETVLMRIFREGYLGSLSVLPECSVHTFDTYSIPLFRPMIDVSREDIIGYAKRWGIEYATDPSNSNNHYSRVWIRNELLPIIRERYPDVDRKILNLRSDSFSSKNHK